MDAAAGYLNAGQYDLAALWAAKSFMDAGVTAATSLAPGLRVGGLTAEQLAATSAALESSPEVLGTREAANAARAAMYKEEDLARQEFAEQAAWKTATKNGDELNYHVYERHPSLAASDAGVVDPRVYDLRARANIANLDADIHSLGQGRYAAFNPGTGEFTVFSWEGGGGLNLGTPTIHSYYIPLKTDLLTGAPFKSRGVVRLQDIRPN